MENTSFLEKILTWLAERGPTIGIIFIVLLVFHFFGGQLIDKAVRKSITQAGGSKLAEKKREDTLIKIFTTTIRVILWTVGGIMILSELQVDIAPLIAGAGLVGVAVGFGAQYLVRDIINGLFLVLENQYRVGDVVELAAITGTVEDITLRKTVLRDLDGTVHHIPNGEIKTASNMSKDFSRVNMNIGVAYESDIEKVEMVINKVGEKLATDPQWEKAIKTPPQFLRIDSFDDSAITVKILGEVAPQEQMRVAGELRRRLKQAFDKEGVEMPYPHRVIKQL